MLLTHTQWTSCWWVHWWATLPYKGQIMLVSISVSYSPKHSADHAGEYISELLAHTQCRSCWWVHQWASHQTQSRSCRWVYQWSTHPYTGQIMLVSTSVSYSPRHSGDHAGEYISKLLTQGKSCWWTHNKLLTHPHTGQIILESTPLPRRHRSQKLWKQVRMQGFSYGSLHRGHCKGFHFLESTSSGFSIGWKISPDIVAFANTMSSPVSIPPAENPPLLRPGVACYIIRFNILKVCYLNSKPKWCFDSRADCVFSTSSSGDYLFYFHPM